MQTSLNLLRPTWIDNIGYAQNDDVMNCDDNGGDENDDGDYDLEEVRNIGIQISNFSILIESKMVSFGLLKGSS